VLVVVDDLHWADTATLELLSLLVQRLADRRVLVLAAHRQLDHGDTSALAGALGGLVRLPGATRLSLGGLASDEVAAVMRSLTGEEPDPQVVEQVHQRSGGNPLFVVELTRLFASEGGHGSGSAEGVPAAVRDVVRRRLARLPEGTLGLLPVAAVLGPELDLRTLTHASGVAIDDCLDDLDPAVVTRVLVPGSDGRFEFGHALVREAVLSDLSPLRLARLHQRAADAIEAVFGADRDHAEPIAAHRWAAAAVDDPLRVTDSLLRGAEAARRHSAIDAAEELIERTVEAARRLPAGPVREDREIDAMERLLHVETVRNFMSRDLPGFAARIEEIAARNQSDAARQLALFVRWSVINQGRLAESDGYARAALELADRADMPYVTVLARYMGGVQCWVTGRIAEACEHFGIALETRAHQRARAAAGEPGAARSAPAQLGDVAAFAFELAGDQARVDVLVEEGMAVMIERGTPAVVVQQAFMAGLVSAVRGDPVATRQWAERALGPEGGSSVPHFTSGSRVLRGWAQALLDHALEGCAESRAGLAELDAGVTTIAVPMMRSLHGEALLAVGRPEEAVAVLERARADSEAEGETWWLPETLRLLAEARRGCGAAPDEVDALLDRALALAESQGEPGLVERVKRSLAGDGAR
jgi:hypothetical protein